MDYEEILLQISDVLRAHNKIYGGISHEEAVIRIREIIKKSEEENT